jgi:hypothetical protein
MKHPDFSKAFQDGQKIIVADEEIILTCHPIGELVLTSGKLVACDPLVCPETKPFAVSLEPGSYPVILSIAHFPETEEQRVACAMIQVVENRIPIRWEMATIPGQDLGSLREREIFGYGVDSGMGCFMDAETAQILIEKLENEEGYRDLLISEFEKTYIPSWSWMNLCLNPSSGANLIAFSSGFGDGFYPTYLGYSPEGRVIRIVTDFDLLEVEEAV